ncbi:MAG: TRAP transporter small permease [Sphaerochaetaceae bacterium]|nr:TRAP transporter small permease [Sphaerochaetaceae bacterium]
MKQILNILSEKLYAICKTASAVLLGVLAVFIFAGVIARYIFNSPFVWLYELTLIMFSWMVFLAISVAVKKGENVTLNLFGTLPKTVNFAFMIIANITTVLFFFFLTKEGIVIIRSTSTETYNTINISTAWFYVLVPVCGIFSLIHMLDAYVNRIDPLNRPSISSEEV